VLLATVPQIYRMIRRRGSVQAFPWQSPVVPFRATDIAVYLENKGVSETA
jgi:hypothetical protein